MQKGLPSFQTPLIRKEISTLFFFWVFK